MQECIQLENSYNCVCKPGWMGRNCETNGSFEVNTIQLRLANDGNANESGRNCETNGSIEVNTSIYNKIIFQVSHMLLIGLCLLLLFIIFTISLDKNDIHFMIRCSKDFAPGILLTVILPIIFFARNKDAFYFVKSCVLCHR